MIDRSLNMELRNGASLGYEKLYSLTSARLKNYCKIFLKDQILVEDIVQNAYLKLWEKRSLILPDKSVESLLFTIVRNQCLNYLRDQKLAGETFSIDESSRSELQQLYQIDFAGMEEKPLEELLTEALKTAIDGLPERQNQVLVKCKIEGKKQKEVAEELGISVKAVEKNLAKAKQRVQENLLSRFPELAVLIAFFLR